MKKFLVLVCAVVVAMCSVFLFGCQEVSGIEGKYSFYKIDLVAMGPEMDPLDEDAKVKYVGDVFNGINLTEDFVVVNLKKGGKMTVTTKSSQGSTNGTYRFENGELYLFVNGDKTEVPASYTDGQIQMQMGEYLYMYKIMVTLVKK